MKTKSINQIIQERTLICDGAMGTSLQKQNLTADDFGGIEGCNEYLNLVKKDAVQQVHHDFLEAGCDIIETNTFGANTITLQDHQLSEHCYIINLEGARIARELAEAYSTSDHPRFISGSIGPGSKLPTLNHTTFNDLKDAYYIQSLGLLAGNVDLFQIETAQDPLQAKAALVALLEVMNEQNQFRPIILQVTMESNGKMLLGTEMEAIIKTFQDYPLFALGLNCGTGPQAMLPHIQVLAEQSPFPISVLPNAGMPRFENNQYYYDLEPEKLAHELAQLIIHYGVAIVGGCCGTTAEHLAEVVRQCAQLSPTRVSREPRQGAASLYRAQEFKVNPKPLIVGERTNANGSKLFREALLKEDWDTMVEIAIQQQDEQAHILDLSLAWAGRDEKSDYARLVPRLNQMLQIPIMLDSTDPESLELSLQSISGRAIINSINLEDHATNAREILNLVKKYNTAVVCLPINDQGMAKTTKDKLELCEELYQLCVTEFQIDPGNLYFDMLTFTLAAGDISLRDSALHTLNAIREWKSRYSKTHTILGLSNISFGLSKTIRPYLNSVFLHHALAAGLDAAILHAGKIIPYYRIPDTLKNLCNQLINNNYTDDGDSPLTELLIYFHEHNSENENESEWNQLGIEEKLQRHIIQSRKRDLIETLEQAMTQYDALSIIDKFLLRGMKTVGELFAKEELQLPFVLQSAETMKLAVDYLKPHIHHHQNSQKMKILLATVKGDVHDIGKNLVDIILTNNGYEVINLGINQTVEQIKSAIESYRPDCLGLSGLLVKSTQVMNDMLQVFNEYNIKIPVICGGAALTETFVHQTLQKNYRGIVEYAPDAFSSIHILEKLSSATN